MMSSSRKTSSNEVDEARRKDDEETRGRRPFVVEANRVRETSQYIALH